MNEKRTEKKMPGDPGSAPEQSGREERFRSLFMGCPVSLWEEDITELLVHLEKLRTSGVRDLRSYFAGHPGEVVRCTGLIKIIGVNNATLDLYEAPDEQSLLAGLSSVFTEESFGAFRDIVIALFEGRTLFEIEATNRTLQGKELQVHLKWSLLPDSGGKLTRVLLSAVDLTERKRIEEERRNNGVRLSRAQAMAHVGDWEWDIATNAVHWSDELYRIYGFHPREVAPDYGLVLQQMHPASKDEFLRAIDAALKEDRHFELDYRFRRKDGTDAVLHTIGQVFRGASGAPVRMAGTVQDITERRRVEDALRDSVTIFRDFVFAQPDPIEVLSLDGTILMCNESSADVYGSTAAERTGQNAFDGIPPGLATERRGLLDRVKTTKQRLWINECIQGRFYETMLSPIVDHSGDVMKVAIFPHDVTERKQAEDALRESEEKFSKSFQKAPLLITLSEVETGRLLEVNEKFLEVSGFTRNEVIGRTVVELGWNSEEQRSRLRQSFLEHGRVAGMELTLRRKDGREINCLYNGEAIMVSGKPRLLSISHDITERVEAERRLRDSEDRFRSIFENAIDGIMIADAGTHMNIEANRAMCAMMGYTRDELLRLPVADVHPKEALPDVLNTFERQLRGEISLAENIPMLRKDGTVFSADVNSVTVDLGGRSCLIGIFRDITDRKRAEEENDRLARAVSIVTEGIAVTDEQDRFIYLNDAHAKTYGYLQSELMGKTWRDVTPREFVPLIEQELARTLRSRENGVWSGESPGLCKDGTGIATEITATSRWNEKGEYAGHICVVRDITERKRAEEKIRQSEEFIRGILDTVDEGFIVVDRDYRIVTANKAYCAQVALPVDEVIGKHCYELSHKVSRPCYEEGEECAVRQVFATGRPHAALHKHPDPEGHTLFVETKAFPIKDASGAVTSVIETINNITERHLLEEERLKTQKLESIGVLAGGIAHDFNNLLQGIFGYISMAKLTLDQREKSLAMLVQAEKALHQSVNLTSQLLTFSKGGKPVKKMIDLRPVIENAIKFALSGSRTSYRFAANDSLWRVEADEGQIGQVIQNIVLNADQAMREGGTVEIAARNIPVGDAAAPQGLGRGDYVELSISDGGIGIPAEYLTKIFDPYFTTKEKGSGLGLATSYSIVKNHDGSISVASELGKGSTFTVYLPAFRAAQEQAAASASAVPVAGRKGRVLVMDDEPIVRVVAGELLRELGHEAEFAEHGDSAIEKYRRAKAEGRPFDVVILDLTIRGGKGGAETLRELLEIDPGVKAVVSSGYSDDEVVATYRQHGFRSFLKKPYDMKELGRMLDDAMA
jgi:two-component system cell cycle sensor histidine kinase/response regulator CckA